MTPIKTANAETTNHSMLNILQFIDAAIGCGANPDYRCASRYYSSPAYDQQDALRPGIILCKPRNQ